MRFSLLKQLFKSPLFYIFCLALFLRIYHLGSVPNGFFRDEAAKGYNAYCISHTGTDMDGQKYPLFTRELKTWNSALYSYLIIPFEKLLGLSEFTTRLPAAMAGCLTVLLLFWVVSLYQGDKKTAIIAAFLLAVCPWHVIFSRWANQGILLPLFITGFLGCMGQYIQYPLKDLSGKKLVWLLLATICIGIGFYTYDIGKVFIPLFLAGYLFAFYKRLNWKHTGLFAVVLLLICLPVIMFTIGHFPISQSRFNRISLFSQGYDFPTLITVFFTNWSSHFSPYFLFLNGDINLRHSVPSYGLIYVFELPLLIIGLWTIIRSNKPFHRFLLVWLLIFPVASSLTVEGVPHALRSICGLPLPSIISAIGLMTAIEGLSRKLSSMNLKRILLISYTVMSFISIIIFIRVYFIIYPVVSAIPFQYGMREMVQYINQHQSQYDQVYLSPSLGFPEIFIYFYNHPLPDKTNQYLLDKHIVLMKSYNSFESFSTPNSKTRNLVISDPADLIGVNPIYTIYSPQGYPIIEFTKD